MSSTNGLIRAARMAAAIVVTGSVGIAGAVATSGSAGAMEGLSIASSADQQLAQVGSDVNVTIAVTNHDATDATNVEIDTAGNAVTRVQTWW